MPADRRAAMTTVRKAIRRQRRSSAVGDGGHGGRRSLATGNTAIARPAGARASGFLIGLAIGKAATRSMFARRR